MKEVFAIIAVVAFSAVMFTSCTPQKQTCAAYSSVDLVDDLESN